MGSKDFSVDYQFYRCSVSRFVKIKEERENMLVILLHLIFATIINSDSTFNQPQSKSSSSEAGAPFLLSESASYFGAKERVKPKTFDSFQLKFEVKWFRIGPRITD